MRTFVKHDIYDNNSTRRTAVFSRTSEPSTSSHKYLTYSERKVGTLKRIWNAYITYQCRPRCNTFNVPSWLWKSKDGSTNAWFCFVKMNQTEIVFCRTLDDMFKDNHKLWTEFPTLMDALASCSIRSSGFILTVASLIRTNIEKELNKIDNVEREV